MGSYRHLPFLGVKERSLLLLSVILPLINQTTRKFGALATKTTDRKSEQIRYINDMQHPIRSITVTQNNKSNDPLLMYVGVNVLDNVIGVRIIASQNENKSNTNSDENRSKFKSI